MRITAAHRLPYALPLISPWHSAATALTERSGWLLRLVTDDGRIGHGECAPLPSHGTESAADAGATLMQWAKQLPGQEITFARKWLASPESYATPAARAALETALLDLLAQRAACPLAEYLRHAPCNAEVAINAMPGTAIGITDEQLKTAVAAGFPVIKLKIGLAPVDNEIAALKRIASHLPPGIALRLDANGAWHGDDALGICRRLAANTDIPVESIEEPISDPSTDSLRELQQALPFPIALDESWHRLHTANLFDAPPVRRLVLKLAPLGGLLPALGLARRASAAGMELLVTTGIDSACGTLAAAHLAAALGNTLAHGLATSSWLATDTGIPPVIANGKLLLPKGVGLGFEAMPDFQA